MQLNSNLAICIYIYMLQRSEKNLNFALPREENKSVTLVMEDGEVAVRGVVTFEVVSLHLIQKYRTVYDPIHLQRDSYAVYNLY
jgi:hypothetical protein